MTLLFQPDALDSSRIPPLDKRRLLQKIEWLWANRGVVTHYPLGGTLSGFYRRKLGKYRIIYTYDPNPDDMVIFLVGLRDDIYEQLK